jgi:lipopolysaccharide export LptBFGC system permease protein LptF
MKMYRTNVSNTNDFVIFEIIDESLNKIDSVVISKYTPDNVLHFYHSVDDYIEEYESKMLELVNRYEGKIDYDNATENRSSAEFILYKSVKGL